MGAETKLKAGLAGEEKGKPPPCGCRNGRGGRRQRGQAPLRVPGRQGRQAAKRASPPAGYHSGKVSWQPTGTSPRRARGSPPFPVPPGFSPGDARGEAPCMKKTLVSPFPTGEGGRGDGGKKASLRQGRQARRKASPPAGAGTAGAAGGKEGNPPPPKEISKILLTR